MISDWTLRLIYYMHLTIEYYLLQLLNHKLAIIQLWCLDSSRYHNSQTPPPYLIIFPYRILNLKFYGNHENGEHLNISSKEISTLNIYWRKEY